MAGYSDHILKLKKIAYAIFDRDLILYKKSSYFKKLVNLKEMHKNQTIWEIFPQLIGCEDEVDAVLLKKKKNYEIKKINSKDESGKLLYYDLTLLPLKEKLKQEVKLLCIVTDKTLETSIEQKLNQQKYEIEILQANLSSYVNFYSGKILGESKQIKEIREFIGKIAAIKNTTILLQGETGTGKNMVARAIHNSSLEPKSPFIEVNCASIPDTLLESEIFGHEKGAFTNAITAKKGLLEEANGGTLFLDEIGELPLALQTKFLSFLETKSFRRLGSIQEKTVNIRVIVATNRDLLKAVRNNEFRQDLYYRINVVSLKLPLLKELGTDTISIAENFIRCFSYDFRKNVIGLTKEAKEKLLDYSWPGNVRELRNVIERAIIFAENSKIDADGLIIAEHRDQLYAKNIKYSDNIGEGFSLEAVEKELLKESLIKAKGNQSRAARLLALSLDTFRYRIKKYNIKI